MGWRAQAPEERATKACMQLGWIESLFLGHRVAQPRARRCEDAWLMVLWRHGRITYQVLLWHTVDATSQLWKRLLKRGASFAWATNGRVQATCWLKDAMDATLRPGWGWAYSTGVL